MEDSNVGKVLGIYTILNLQEEKDKDGHKLYECQCNICKQVFTKRLYYIEHSKKCCHTHANWTNRRIGRIYREMVNRCYNHNAKDYRWYGEKGVEICQEWIDNPALFEKWALSSGYSDFLTIDRITSDQNYCPENCRWIPLEENSRRAGKVNWITVDNITLTGLQWAKQFNIGVNRINTYVRKYGIDKTKELISAMLKNPPLTKTKKSNQTWFSVYGIQV